MVMILAIISTLFILSGFATCSVGGENGILVLAHGGHGAHGTDRWNEAVREAVEPLREKYNVEIAFGMAELETIQEAISRLEHRGARHIVAVPLFISSHSSIVVTSRRALGLDPALPIRYVKSSASFSMTAALDTSPLVADVVLERARELSKEPGGEVVVMVAHGPNDPEDNRLWLRDMGVIAQEVKKAGDFKDILVTTVRDDAPEEIRQEATRVFREMVEGAGQEAEVLVIPYLIASGGIEAGVEGRLKGLRFKFGRPLLPHPNITKWIETSARPYLE